MTAKYSRQQLSACPIAQFIDLTFFSAYNKGRTSLNPRKKRAATELLMPRIHSAVTSEETEKMILQLWKTVMESHPMNNTAAHGKDGAAGTSHTAGTN